MCACVCVCVCVCACVCCVVQVVKEIWEGFRMSPPPGVIEPLYQLMIECWYVFSMLGWPIFLYSCVYVCVCVCALGGSMAN